METGSGLNDAVPAHLLEPLLWTGPGYQPVVDFGGWRTALMNFHPKYRPAALKVMEAHRDTDEVFVLLQGRCTLFFGEGETDQGAGQSADQGAGQGAGQSSRQSAEQGAVPGHEHSRVPGEGLGGGLATPLRPKAITRVYAADMRPGIVYNVRRGAFHTHALSEDAVVLVVENSDTGDHNTDFLPIGEQALRQLETLARRSWTWD